MARTQKKAQAVTVAMAEAVEATALTAEIRSGKAVTEVVAALPAPTAMSGA